MEIVVTVFCWGLAAILSINGFGEAVNFMGDRPWRKLDLIVGGVMMILAALIFNLPKILFT